MTLVIAKSIGAEIQLESDTQISSKDPNHKNPYLSGILKAVIISPDFAIGYAGTIWRGCDLIVQNLIDGLFQKKADGALCLEIILEECLEANLKSDNQTDFVIASNLNDGDLYRVRNGAVEGPAKSYWIGDQPGFESFQQSFVPSYPSENKDGAILRNSMSAAFAEVILANISGIGGWHIGIDNRDGYFGYTLRLNALSLARIEVPPGEKRAVTFGSAGDGSFASSYMVSETKEKPAIAIYIPQGNMGILYFPEQFNCGETIKNVTGAEFIKRVERQYGIKLAAFLIDTQKGRIQYVGEKARRTDIKVTLTTERAPRKYSSPVWDFDLKETKLRAR